MSNERTGVLELTLGDSYIGSAYSPTVEVTDTETGHEVAITYMSPEGIVTERFDVADGEQGPQGPAGYSPTVTITDTPTGHTVTITDADGPHSYDVPNYAQEEQERQDAWDELSGDVTDAITAAESATSAASTAAQSATGAASSATSAAQAANTAAASANTAASSANAAATAANSAASAAGTAADAATTAAGDATDAASAANTAAQAAQDAATELAPEVKWLWGNQLTGELTGDLLTVADAYAAPPMALTVDGRSTQASTTGKNLLDRSTEESGYINANGGQSGSNDWYRSGYIPIVAGTAYTFSPNSTSGNSAYGCWYDANKDVLSTFPSGQTTQTAPADAAYVRVSYRVASTNVQLELGSTATAYEPYTGGKPSPSPDYPQPIVSVGELTLAFAGKNWLDVHAERKTSTRVAKDGSGVWYPYAVSNYLNNFSGNSLSIDGDTVAFTSKASYGFGVETRVLSDATYTISAQSITVSDGAAYDIRMNYFRKDGTFSYRTVGTNVNRATVTIPSDAIYAIFVVCVSEDAVSTIAVKGLQLEIGSTVTAYEPYEGHAVPIDLQDHELRSLPDGTRDTLALAYLRPSTREGWAWYQATLTALVGETTTAATDGITGTVGVDVMSTTGEIADGPTVLYKLATPVTTQLDPIELPVLPAPTCTVWADPTTGLAMEYVRDTNIVIASLEAAYADLATS